MQYKNLTLALITLIIGFIFIKLAPIKPDSPDLKCPNCNVILIGVDTLRADHLSSYGYEKIKTPNIDSLANQGVLFKNNFSQSINTTPSFMSIFTSLYPTDTGELYTSSFPNSNQTPVRINDNIKTLAEVLKDNGYQTQGFTTSLAVAGGFGFENGFNSYSTGGILSQRKKFIDYLKQPHKEKFFVFFHDLIPHAPYDSTNKYFEINNENFVLPITNFLSKFDPNSSTDMQALSQLYDQNIKDEDNYINLVLQTLKEQNLIDKTIIVFMSDHGEELGDHGALDHLEFYNEILHVPLVIHIPGLKNSVVVNQVTRSIDVMPTILDILGIKINFPVRGISLLPMIINPQQNLDLPAISIMGNEKSIIMNGYKYIDQREDLWTLKKKVTKEFYNLATDPKEKNNLINKNLPIQKKLIDYLEKIVSDKTYFKPPTPIENTIWRKDILNQLRNLGY